MNASPPHPLYPCTLRTLHWLIAALILGLIAVGYYMAGIADDDPLRGTLYGLHKSFGVAALVLIAIRIAVRLRHTIPPLPSSLPRLERRAAHAAHILLYIGMVGVPVSGLVMSMAGGHGVAFFGIPLPNPMETDRALAKLAHDAHGILPYVLLGVIALHIAGELKHRFFDRPEHDVLARMGIPRKPKS